MNCCLDIPLIIITKTCSDEYVDCWELILKRKPIDINLSRHSKQSMLQIAIKNDSIKMVKLLLSPDIESKCDINKLDTNGISPLFNCIMKQKSGIEMVKEILKEGWDVYPAWRWTGNIFCIVLALSVILFV